MPTSHLSSSDWQELSRLSQNESWKVRQAVSVLHSLTDGLFLDSRLTAPTFMRRDDASLLIETCMIITSGVSLALELYRLKRIPGFMTLVIFNLTAAV